MKFPEEVYSSKRFREQGAAVIELIASCMEDSISGKQDKVVELSDPVTAMREVQQWFDRSKLDEYQNSNLKFDMPLPERMNDLPAGAPSSTSY